MPAPSVYIFENHDTAYYRWRELGVTNRALVHVDAHHDAWALKEFSSVTIANFITLALRQGIVREVAWVVPDASFADETKRNAVRMHLRRLARGHGGSKVIFGASSARTLLDGVSFSVCTRRELPRFAEPVLLDIDTDYLVIPEVTYGGYDRHSSLPWCWPEELLASLAAAGLEAEHATVAYSVEGGFTPLFWKFLGDELAERLKGADPTCLRGFLAMHDAVRAVSLGDANSAEASYQVAQELLPQHAAPRFHQALLQLRLGRIEQAQEKFRRAVELDKSYSTPYRNAAIALINGRSAAAGELQEALLLDPGDAAAYYGMARVAMQNSNWNDAREHLRRAIELAPAFLDAHRAMGEVEEKLGHSAAALTAYDESLKLSLSGQRPLLDSGIVDGEYIQVLDPEHGKTQASAARLLARAGRLQESAAAYQIAFASRYNGVAPRLGLAWVLLRQNKPDRAIGQIGRAISAVGIDTKWLWKRFTRTPKNSARPWTYAEFAAKIQPGRLTGTTSTS